MAEVHKLLRGCEWRAKRKGVYGHRQLRKWVGTLSKKVHQEGTFERAVRGQERCQRHLGGGSWSHSDGVKSLCQSLMYHTDHFFVQPGSLSIFSPVSSYPAGDWSKLLKTFLASYPQGIA